MIDLAQQDSDKYIPLNEIAARQEISLKYLEAIVKLFVKANLLTGHRGKNGGYKLTRKPEEYPVGEILEIAEGTLSPVSCLSGNYNSCPRKESCSTLLMWTRFDNMVHDFFYGVSLKDILNPADSIIKTQ